MGYDPHMADVYGRLTTLGFDAKFIRAAVLPDWWEDALAAVPANRALAETAIARQLGFPVTALRDPQRELNLPPLTHLKLKRNQGTRPKDIQPALVVAQRVARLVVNSSRHSAEFAERLTAVEVRNCLRAQERSAELGSLVALCWEHGISVVHLSRLPKAAGAKKFDGMALFCSGRPVIVLASGRDSPPWLAYHLAHELGHIMLGHVTLDSEPLVDSTIDCIDNDDQEQAADRYACEVLTGKPILEFKPRYGLTAPKLVDAAKAFGKTHHIAPGVVALIYGHTADRYPVAVKALALLGTDAGGHAIIADAIQTRLGDADLPESAARFLECVVGDRSATAV